MVALLDMAAVKFAVPGGIGHRAGADGGDGALHILLVLLRLQVVVKGQHGADALGDGLCGQHHHLLVAEGGGLLSGHDDVLVVGQDENDLRRGQVNGPQDVFGRGVHGLAAAHHVVGAQLPEQIHDALAGGHGHKAVAGDRRGVFPLAHAGLGLLGHLLPVLLDHVLHLDGDELAVFQRLAQSQVGLVGVDVDLDDLVILHHHHAVADGGQKLPQVIGVLGIFPGADELGAVVKVDLLLVKGGEVGGFYRHGGVDHRHRDLPGQAGDGSAEGVLHALQDQQIAVSARVHHAGLFQHRVLVGGLLQRLFGGLDGGAQHGLGVPGLFGGLHRRVAGDAGHGEDGALGGLHHRLVGGGAALPQALGQGGAVGGAGVLHALCDATEQQGGDDAGIAPGAPQQGAGGDLQGAAQGGVFQLVQRVGRVVQGHGHIGAGVAVGHREHIEGVDFLHPLGHGFRGLQDHFFIGFAIDHFRHIASCLLTLMRQAFTVST